MNRTDIDWPWQPLYTWNPVTGCKAQCEYCYARRIHERFNTTPYTEIVEHPGRWSEPARHKKPRAIFVGSMTDICWWTVAQVERLIGVMAATPLHTYLLLSKRPEVYREYEFPGNAVCGATVDGRNADADKHRLMSLYGTQQRIWLSVEPLLGPVDIFPVVAEDLECVVVGAQTRPTVVPDMAWIDAIRASVPEANLHIKAGTRAALTARGGG